MTQDSGAAYVGRCASPVLPNKFLVSGEDVSRHPQAISATLPKPTSQTPGTQESENAPKYNLAHIHFFNNSLTSPYLSCSTAPAPETSDLLSPFLNLVTFSSFCHIGNICSCCAYCLLFHTTLECKLVEGREQILNCV